AVSVPVRVVRLTEAPRGLARHEHGSALLALVRLGAGLGRGGDRPYLLGLAGALRHAGPAGLGAAGGCSRPARAQRTGPLAAPPCRRFAPGTAGCGALGCAARRRVPLVDPDLHTDTPERGPCLEEPVLDVGPQSVQRNPAFAVELGTAHLGAAEAAR